MQNVDNRDLTTNHFFSNVENLINNFGSNTS